MTTLTDFVTGKQIPDTKEERVRQALVKDLVQKYGYSKQRIKRDVPVPMGVETKEADLVVYSDDALTKALIRSRDKSP